MYYQSFLKATAISIILSGNTISLGMLLPNNSHFTKTAKNYYQKNFSPHYAETLYIEAQKNNTPLQVALTTRQLLLLADKYFNESLPASPLQCSSLNEDKNYEKSYLQLNLLQQKRLAVFHALPKTIAKEKITNQLQQMEKRLLDDEYLTWQNLVNVFVKEYNLDEKFIISYTDCKELHRILLEKKHCHTTCDEGLPKKWIYYLSNAMIKKGLNLNNINLKISNDTFKNHIALSSNPTKDRPATIALNKKYCEDYDEDILKHAANHELRHLLCGHGTIMDQTLVSLLYSSIKSDNNFDVNGPVTNKEKNKITELRDQIETSQAWISLSLAHERSADALSALENPESAYCAQWLIGGYLGSHNNLLIAATNWEALELLEKPNNGSCTLL